MGVVEDAEVDDAIEEEPDAVPEDKPDVEDAVDEGLEAVLEETVETADPELDDDELDWLIVEDPDVLDD